MPKTRLLKPLSVAVCAALLAACGSTPSTQGSRPAPTSLPKAPTTSTPSTQVTPAQTADQLAISSDDLMLDADILAQLEDLLQATDMSMVEGDALTVQRYGDLWDRVRRGYRMPQVQNARIEAQKSWFYSRQSYIDRLTARASRYLHYTVAEAERRGIPTELALLPIIESSYDPAATSNAAAAGLWQFIPSTGRIYGLNQSVSYDGRRDVIESTRAAYDFLTSLYNQFGSWELALAAYNAGPGRISRAIKANQAAGLPTDYWSLKLPKETMNYVPRFLAVSQIVQSPSSYGIHLPAIANHNHFRTVPVRYGVNLQEVSGVTGVPFEELRLLNPALTNYIVDAAGPSRIVIPDSVSAAADAQLSALMGYGGSLNVQAPTTQYVMPISGVQTNSSTQQELMQANVLPTTIAQITPNNTIVQEPPLTAEERDFIAAQIQANSSDVQPINPQDGNIQLDAVQTAQSVLESRGQSKSISYASNAPAPAIVHQPVVQPTPVYAQTTPVYAPQPTPQTKPQPTPKPAAKPQPKPVAKPESYTVKSGDTLTAIAAAHGLSISQLASYNNLATDAKVLRGQKLWLVAGKVQPKKEQAQTKPQSTSQAKPQQPKTQNHRVQSGESLTSVANKYGMTVQELATLNGLKTTDGLVIGQSLKVAQGSASNTAQSTPKATPKTNAQTNTPQATQPKTQNHRVQSGESLTSVANKYGMTVQELATLNGLKTTDGLVIGQSLKVAQGSASNTAQSTPKATPKTTTPSPVQPAKASTPTENYQVQAGDSLTKVAQKHDVSVADLAKLNGLSANASLRAGQSLKVPKVSTDYTVKSGDNLTNLARRHGVSVQKLAQMNNMKPDDTLRIGQVIAVPVK